MAKPRKGRVTVSADGVITHYKWGTKKRLIHRDDGPAIIYPNGDEYHFKMGKCHRVGGPAVKYADGSYAYLQNGEYHREDGPAVTWPNGQGDYYIRGAFLTEEQFLKRTQKQA